MPDITFHMPIIVHVLLQKTTMLSAFPHFRRVQCQVTTCSDLRTFWLKVLQYFYLALFIVSPKLLLFIFDAITKKQIQRKTFDSIWTDIHCCVRTKALEFQKKKMRTSSPNLSYEETQHLLPSVR